MVTQESQSSLRTIFHILLINMTTKNDKEVLIRAMREYMKEDGDLIDELDQRLAEATSQRDEALERIDALIAEVEQWKRIAMDYAFDETE